MTDPQALVREARAHANISQLGDGARSLILELADALDASTKGTNNDITVSWYRMTLDKAIAEYEDQASCQKELMDKGNSFAAGRWTEMNEIVRYLKWIRRE